MAWGLLRRLQHDSTWPCHILSELPTHNWLNATLAKLCFMARPRWGKMHPTKYNVVDFVSSLRKNVTNFVATSYDSKVSKIGHILKIWTLRLPWTIWIHLSTHFNVIEFHGDMWILVGCLNVMILKYDENKLMHYFMLNLYYQ